jgi:hypothetical protein
MQLLIVHSDADLGEQLLQVVKDYTAHNCDLVASGDEAIAWAGRKQQCEFLLTQLDAEGIDGLSLGGSFSEIFPKLQTAFFPNYSATEERLDVSESKVFPEPIDGERMLKAITRAEKGTAEGHDLFHATDLLQMCCLSRKIGVVYLREGAILQADTGDAKARDALSEMAGWSAVEFAFDSSVTIPIRSITRPWHEVLIEAVLRSKQRKVTPRN